MNSLGIVRKVDVLGRVVLPIELRRTLDIDVKDQLEIFVDGDSIIFRKYQETCYICNTNKGYKKFMGKNICNKCIQETKLL